MKNSFIDKDISVKWQEDISAITSLPCFEKERSPSYGGSLFSRLATAQMTARQEVLDIEFQAGSVRIGSPIDSSYTEPSPIKASDSLIEYEPELSCDNHSFVEKSINHSAKFKANGHVPLSSQSITSNKSNRRERILSLLDAIDSIDVDGYERKLNFSLDNKHRHSIDHIHKRSISMSLDTSRNSRSEQTSAVLNDSKSSHQTDGTFKKDEWKEVIDPESGRTYYYNRKSRVSKWKLPKGAVLVKPKASSRSVSFQNSDISLQHTKKLESKKTDDPSSTSASRSSESNDMLYTKSSPRANRTGTQVSFADSHGELSYDTRQLRSNPTLQANLMHNDRWFTRGDASFQSPTCQSSYQERAAIHFKSPQDCTPKEGSANFFCMFCGVSCSLESFGLHLTGCQSKQLDSSTKKTLANVIFNALAVSNGTTRGYQTPHPQKHIAMNESASVHSASSNDHALDSYEQDVPTPSKQYQRKELEDYCTEVEAKTCPFCKDSFSKGNQFSGHLLKCPERRRGRNRRIARKAESEVTSCPRARAEQKRSTPGRKLPWG
ncbi:hypothetical protein ACHAWO_008615 [Cyclotella atomus]|uniref:WW domain-containing protein n=1 Tax=Cyclotella atomus TaxID=382360 RepID=A0ABD3N2P4_9STRA